MIQILFHRRQPIQQRREAQVAHHYDRYETFWERVRVNGI